MPPKPGATETRRPSGVDRYIPRAAGARAPGELERGRKSYQRRAWADAYQALSLADRAAPLAAGDLELLAMSAYLIGLDDDYLRALERAHHVRLDAGERLHAVRCAFWLGVRLLFRGEVGRATGWLARARRLLEPEARDCAEQGYLLLQAVEESLAGGDGEAAYAAATGAAEIGERCEDADLIACARHLQGRVRIQEGRIEQGLALLDEAMIAVTAGELSPLVTGLIYCSVIEACQQVYALGRAREWTSALPQWCEGQPEMVAFTGVCRVHRAEIMQLQGAWRDAIEEARRACERCLQAANRPAAAAAFYQEAEIHRLQGELAAAEAAYRSASQWGWDPERLRQELTKVGLREVKIVTTTEAVEFQTGRDLWDWLISSNPIAELVLGGLNLTGAERDAIPQALEGLVRERADGGRAVLTAPINIGIGTK